MHNLGQGNNRKVTSPVTTNLKCPGWQFHSSLISVLKAYDVSYEGMLPSLHRNRQEVEQYRFSSLKVAPG